MKKILFLTLMLPGLSKAHNICTQEETIKIQAK